VVNALVVHGLHVEPADAGIGLKVYRDIPYHVLHEHWVVVSLHGDVSLVRTLEQRIDGRGRRSLGNVDELFDPNELRGTVCSAFSTNCNTDHSALIVRAVIADSFAAWAKTRDRYVNADDKVEVPSVQFAKERALVIH